MTIWFDLDGTLANLYGVENWLPMIEANDPTPYLIAKPMLRLSTLAYMLNKLRASGHDIGIISWTSKMERLNIMLKLMPQSVIGLQNIFLL